MDINTFKEMIKKYEPYHTAFVNDAMIGERYYGNASDIVFADKKEDAEGNSIRNADNRIPRNFHGLIVNQKAAYAFTVPPLFDIGNDAQNKKVTQALGDEYAKNCMELCINAANTHVAWLHYWKGTDGSFEYAVVDSKQIIPVWDKSLKRKLLGVLRVYPQLDDDTGDNYTIYEYWTEDRCEAYRKRTTDTLDDSLSYYEMFIDPSTTDRTAEYAHGMNEVPFIPFFNNNVHTSDLKNIKRLIDVYDKVYSGFINDLDDVQELILILTGYGGTELNGFLQDLKKYKVIKLDEDENSSVSTLNIEIPVEARKTVLDLTRKAIFEQGMAFDPQPENFGNQSGVALKFMYALLEMKTGLMETEFRLGFARLIRAICHFYNLPCAAINQTWTRTSIRNEQELAQICSSSVGVISKRTIVKNHPFVENADEELVQMEEEEQKEQEKSDIYSDAFSGKEDIPEDS